jgi:hypothetical protein
MTGFRYTKTDGEEVIAPDLKTLRRDLAYGHITADTPVLDTKLGVKLKAAALIAFHRKAAQEEPAETPDVAEATGAAGASAARDAPSGGAAIYAPPRASPTGPKYGGTVRKTPEADPADERRRAIASVIGALSLAAWPAAMLYSIKTAPELFRLAGIALLLCVIAAPFIGGAFGKGAIAAKLGWTWSIGAIATAAGILLYGFAQIEREGAGTASASDRPSVSKPSSAGQISQKYRTELDAIAKQQHQELNVLEIDKVLTADRLTTAAGVAQNRAVLEKIGPLFEAHAAREADALVRYRAELATASSGAERLAAFDAAAAQRETTQRQFVALQRELAEKLGAVNDFAAARQGSIKVEDGKLVFFTQGDLDRFNQMIGALGPMSERETVLIKTLKQEMDGVFAVVERGR